VAPRLNGAAGSARRAAIRYVEAPGEKKSSVWLKKIVAKHSEPTSAQFRPGQWIFSVTANREHPDGKTAFKVGHPSWWS
jgi:hypothetical protein